MKRKFLLPILSVCMVVALVSVGFAAWLITGNDTTGASGQFVTYEATNNYFTVKAESATGASIKFAKGGSISNTNPWFNFDGNDTESLTATFTITITPDVAFNESNGRDVQSVLGTTGEGQSKKNNVVKFKLTETPKDAQSGTSYDKFDSAVTANYVVNPTFKVNSGNAQTIAGILASGLTIELVADDFEVNTDNLTASATVTLTFAWGSAFNSTNPYEYYNGFAVVGSVENVSIKKPGESGYPTSDIIYATASDLTKDQRNEAATALNTLNGLNGTTFYIMLDVEPTNVNSGN